MPSTVESAESPTTARRDSAFFDEETMERLRPASLTTDHIRVGSVGSGLSGAELDMQSSPRVKLPIRRVQSGSLRRPRTDSTLVYGNISEQTQLLLRKMAILEQKLKSMDSQLKNEQVQRLGLEAKVLKLEEENKKLKVKKVKAGQQLQEFAEKFYTMTEVPKGSPCPSPIPSMSELRVRSSSISSNSSSSSRSRPPSGVSF